MAAAAPAPCTQVTAAQNPMAAPSVSVPASHQPGIPLDLEHIMAAATEAALKQMKKLLEATVMPMQRTIESLQAEFVTLRSKEKDDSMSSCVATDAKRLRLGSDV